jgi:hypothetical protein
MLAYLSEVEHRIAFLKVHEVLRLTEMPMRKTSKTQIDLEKEVADLKRLVHGLIATRGDPKKALELAQLTTIPFNTEEVEREEKLREIGNKILETRQKLSKEQLAEYKRIIAENNNNHNNE